MCRGGGKNTVVAPWMRSAQSSPLPGHAWHLPYLHDPAAWQLIWTLVSLRPTFLACLIISTPLSRREMHVKKICSSLHLIICSSQDRRNGFFSQRSFAERNDRAYVTPLAPLCDRHLWSSAPGAFSPGSPLREWLAISNITGNCAVQG